MPETCQKCGIEALEDGVCSYCGAGKPEGDDAEAFAGDVKSKDADEVKDKPKRRRAIHVGAKKK